MSTLENEVRDKFRQLDREAQLSLLEEWKFIYEPEEVMDDEEWLEKAKALHAELVAKYGEGHYFDSVDVINEIREEATWQRD
jgi:hypothetical protein